MRFPGFVLPSTDDPSPFFSLLNLLGLQTSLLLRYPKDKFIRNIKDRKTSGSLAFLVKTFCHLNGQVLKVVDDMEPWMGEHVKEQMADLERKLLMILCRVVEESPDARPFFLDNNLCALEHLILLFNVVPRHQNDQAAVKVLNFMETTKPFQEKLSNFVMELTKGGEEKAVWLLLFLWMSQGRFELPVYMAVIRYADANGLLNILDNLLMYTENYSDGDRETLGVFLSGTKNFKNTKLPPKISLSVKMASLAMDTKKPKKDDFAALLDDKSYINRVKETVLEMSYDPEYDDEPVDLYDESGSPAVKTPAQILEEDLLRAYIKDASIFERTAKARQSAGRKQLCEKLKLAHEQVEGWAIMFSRNPRKETLLRDYQLINYKTL